MHNLTIHNTNTILLLQTDVFMHSQMCNTTPAVADWDEWYLLTHMMAALSYTQSLLNCCFNSTGHKLCCASWWWSAGGGRPNVAYHNLSWILATNLVTQVQWCLVFVFCVWNMRYNLEVWRTHDVIWAPQCGVLKRLRAQRCETSGGQKSELVSHQQPRHECFMITVYVCCVMGSC